MSEYDIVWLSSERKLCSDGRIWYKNTYRIAGTPVQAAATADSYGEARAVVNKLLAKKAKEVLGLPAEAVLEEFDEYELPF